LSDIVSTKFWDMEWKEQKIEKHIEDSIDKQILTQIVPALKKNSKILELGCVPGGRLNFLKKHFDVITYGLDYSLYGLLRSLNSGYIVCADFFHAPFRNNFDLVFSLGVVEHFEDPKKAIAIHTDLTKKGSLVLITIPNFSKYSTLSTAFKIGGRFEKVKQTHNMKIMDIEKFRELFTDDRVETLLCDYYGPPQIYSLPNPKIKKIFSKINKTIDKFSLRSNIFSPYMIFVGKRK